MGLLALNKKLEAAEDPAEKREIRRKIIIEKAGGIIGRLREAQSLPGLPGSPGGSHANKAALRDAAEMVYVEGWGDLGVHTIAKKAEIDKEFLYEQLEGLLDDILREGLEALPEKIEALEQPELSALLRRTDTQDVAGVDYLGVDCWRVQQGHDEKFVDRPEEAVDQAIDWLKRKGVM